MNEPPLRFGAPEEFALVVAALRSADYTERTVRRTLGLENMSGLGPAELWKTDLSSCDPRLALLIRMFLFFDLAVEAELVALFGQSALDALVTLEIIAPDASGLRYHATVFLYPVGDLYIASDRPVERDGRPPTRNDWVFPAIFEGTLTFLGLLPTVRIDEALDLGAGTGVAALQLSRHACRAVAVDISARATHYASFNQQLNARENVEVLQGDLYGAVAGRTFDCIVAHPPYVPALRNQMIYRDGGETGEYLVRRIVEGLPVHLREGGTYFGLSLNIDTSAAPFEDRVRQWLGHAQLEFDVVFATLEEKSPETILVNVAGKDPTFGPPELARLRKAFDEIGAVRFVYGALVVRRRAPADRGPPRTVRTRVSANISETDLRTLLRTGEETLAAR